MARQFNGGKRENLFKTNFLQQLDIYLKLKEAQRLPPSIHKNSLRLIRNLSFKGKKKL